jgi:hypothetical protein
VALTAFQREILKLLARTRSPHSLSDNFDVEHLTAMADRAVRFFPAIRDPDLGWRLHDVDIAVNKVLAMAGRREPRDYVDVVAIHRSGLHLASLAWAACGKDPGMTPFLILDEITRHSNYTAEALRAGVSTGEPVVGLKRDLLRAVGEARDLFATLPLSQAGHLYLDRDEKVRLPNPAAVEAGELRLHSPLAADSFRQRCR